jgi:hypothetical protein
VTSHSRDSDAAERKRRQRERAGRSAQRCGARTRSGKCGLPAGWGTDHPGVARCRWHGGASPNGRQAAARQQATQEAAVADRQLQLVDAGDVLELALAVANHRLEKIQERYGAQLDAGDLALLGVEGETLDRAARIAKVVIDLDLDVRRWRNAESVGTAVGDALNRALGAAFPDMTPEQHVRFTGVFTEGLARLEERPAGLLAKPRENDDA